METTEKELLDMGQHFKKVIEKKDGELNQAKKERDEMSDELKKFKEEFAMKMN